eukprot:TRINITY_DN3034_c0_g2_i4.p1 TRINITY_DN3034_c0_g2~~TRINITY_DN3034_c0_g2_i4.p1  ORF type:complete len:820 (-),score=168.53 TRINITY_DN3034_c0_g2_i4:173-2632(-)
MSVAPSTPPLSSSSLRPSHDRLQPQPQSLNDPMNHNQNHSHNFTPNSNTPFSTPTRSPFTPIASRRPPSRGEDLPRISSPSHEALQQMTLSRPRSVMQDFRPPFETLQPIRRPQTTMGFSTADGLHSAGLSQLPTTTNATTTSSSSFPFPSQLTLSTSLPLPPSSPFAPTQSTLPATQGSMQSGIVDDSISDVVRRQNHLVDQMLQSVQRFDQRRNEDRVRGGKKGNLFENISEEERQRIFDATIRDLTLMLESVSSAPKSIALQQSASAPSANQSLSSSTQQSTLNPGAKDAIGLNASAQGVNGKHHQQGPGGNMSGSLNNIDPDEPSRDRILPPMAMTGNVAERAFPKGMTDRERNPTIRFLRAFLHAPYEKRIKILHHREWDAISATLLERCTASAEATRKEHMKLYRLFQERNRELIQLRSPEKHIEVVKQRAQKHLEHLQTVQDRKLTMDKQIFEKKWKSLQEKEESRRQLLEAKKDLESGMAKRKVRIPKSQQLWFIVFCVAKAQSSMTTLLKQKQRKAKARLTSGLVSESVKFLQLLVRWQLSKRLWSKRGEKKGPTDLCRFVLRKWIFETAYGRRVRQKNDSADIVRYYLTDCLSIAKTVRLIKNFRYSVMRIQRWYRRIKLIQQARMQLMLIQWRNVEEERRRVTMTKKNLTTLTKAQRQRIQEMQQNGKKIQFHEFVKENLEKAKKSQMRVPHTIKEVMLKQYLQEKLLEHRTRYRHWLRVTGQVKDRRPNKQGMAESARLVLQGMQSREPRTRPPKMRVLLTQDELQRLIEKGLEMSSARERYPTQDMLSFSKSFRLQEGVFKNVEDP